MGLVWTNFNRARADRLPDEKCRDLPTAERRGHYLRIQVYNFYGCRIYVILTQILGYEPRSGGSDTRRDFLAYQILRRCNVFSRYRNVAFSIPFHYRDEPIVPLRP